MARYRTELDPMNCSDENLSTDGSSDLPHGKAPTLVDTIVEQISADIAAHKILPGAKMLSIRQQASSRGVAPTTIVSVYDRLVALGKVESKQNRGFYVQPIQRGTDRMPVPPTGPSAERAIAGSDRFPVEEVKLLEPGSGRLPHSWLEDDAIRKAMHAVARAKGSRLLDYGHRLGFTGLRERLCGWLIAQELYIQTSQILLTAGATYSVDLICKVLLRPGDAVFVDDPCYPKFLQILANHPITIVPVPFTRTGPDLAKFDELAERHRPRLYLRNAGPHNPTGVCLSTALAHQLLKICERHDVQIVEDDVFGDVSAQAGARLSVTDQLNRTIYVSSYSKTLSAAVRCGYVVARPDLIERLADHKLSSGFGNDDIPARIVDHILEQGAYRKRVVRIADRLASFRGKTLQMLSSLGIEPWVEPESGLFVWASFPGGRDTNEIAACGKAQGITFAPYANFTSDKAQRSFMRFNVAHCLDQRVVNFLAQELKNA